MEHFIDDISPELNIAILDERVQRHGKEAQNLDFNRLELCLSRYSYDRSDDGAEFKTHFKVLNSNGEMLTTYYGEIVDFEHYPHWENREKALNGFYRIVEKVRSGEYILHLYNEKWSLLEILSDSPN